MRMCHRKIGEVPQQIGGAEGFHCSLHGSGEIKNNRHYIKRKHITELQAVPGPANGHHEIHTSGRYGNNHSHTCYDGDRLHPPGNGTEDKMMRSDKGIEKNLGPECQNAQTVRIYGTIEFLREKIIHQSEVQKHEPHANTLVHEIPLDNRLSQPLLPERKVGYHENGNYKHHGCYDVPIGHINFFCFPGSYGFQKIVNGDNNAYSKKGHDRPDVFAVFSATVVNSRHQEDTAN